MTFTFRRGKKQ